MLKIISLSLSLTCVLLLRDCCAQQLTLSPEMSQETVQKLLDSSVRSKRVVFSPGDYTRLSQLRIDPARVVSIQARGAKFLFPAEQKKFTRLFSIIWTSQRDSPVFTFEGGEIDMNEENQSRQSYNKEHQAGIFADATSTGRLNLLIQNVTVKDSAGDGISIYRNSRASLKDVEVRNCFRGGLTVSAGGNEITVDKLDARGHRFHSGLRFEPSGQADRQKLSTYVLKNVRTTYINFQLGVGSKLTMIDSQIDPISPYGAKEGHQGYIYNEGGEILFDKCVFYSNRPLTFQLTGTSTIQNSQFKMSRYNEEDQPGSSIAITLRWYYKPAGKFNENQTFTLSNCEFSIHNLPTDAARPYAVRTFETDPYGGENNRVIIKDVSITDDHPWGGLYVLAGKASKTKVILKDNRLGEKVLEDRE